MKLRFSLAARLVPVFFASTSADAGLVSYPDLASWNAATVGKITVNVPDPSSIAGFDDIGSAGVSYGSVTFSSDLAQYNGGFFNVGPIFSGQPAVLAAQQLGFDLVNILITLPKAASSFSVNFGTFDGDAVTFLLSNGHAVTKTSSSEFYSTSNFFGVTDTNAFTTVLITSTDESLFLNNISFGSVSAIPELSTWAMMLIGFSALGFFIRRDRTDASRPRVS